MRNERRVDDVVIVDLEGKFTVADDDLGEVLTELLDRGEKQIVLNMAGVEYLDSTNVGELVAGHRTALQLDADIKLLNLPPRTRELLELHHLLEIFEHFDDEDAAVESFSS